MLLLKPKKVKGSTEEFDLYENEEPLDNIQLLRERNKQISRLQTDLTFTEQRGDELGIRITWVGISGKNESYDFITDTNNREILQNFIDSESLSISTSLQKNFKKIQKTSNEKRTKNGAEILADFIRGGVKN